MTTTTDIVNRALLSIGMQKKISSLNQDSAEAQTANLIIDELRDDLLRMAPWQCAKGMIDLQYITSLPGTPENQSQAPNQYQWTSGLPLPPWTYEYAYPEDCVRALWIVPQFNSGIFGTPVYPTTTSTGYSGTFQGPPIKFDVGNDNFYPAIAATVANGGAGYAVGDFITLALGPITSNPVGNPAILQVTAETAGVITAVSIYTTEYDEATPQSGGYFLPQTTAQAQGSTTGSGTGATFNLTFGPQGNQRVILTNQEYAVLSYNRRVTDPNTMDSLFQRAWVNVLGANICMALKGEIGLANSRIAIANQAIAEARTADSNEALTVNDVIPDWIRVRGITSSDYWNNGTGYGWDGLGLWPSY